MLRVQIKRKYFHFVLFLLENNDMLKYKTDTIVYLIIEEDNNKSSMKHQIENDTEKQISIYNQHSSIGFQRNSLNNTTCLVVLCSARTSIMPCGILNKSR